MRPVAHRRFMAEFALVIERQTEESARNLSRRSRHNAAETARSLHRRVIVEDQVARRFRPFLRMAGDATAIKNRLDIAEILDVFDALLEAQAGRIVLVPLLAG